MHAGEVYGFTPAEMAALFRAHGFRLDSMCRFMLGLNCLYVFVRDDTIERIDDTPLRRLA
jgi:hypothetical protein